MAGKKGDKKSKNDSSSESKNGNENVTKSYCRKSNVCTVLASLSIILVGVAVYQIYVTVTFIPDLPEIDLNLWWGSDEARNDQDTSIRPFKIVVSESMQEILYKRFDSCRRRVNKKKSLEEEWSYGMHSDAVGHVFGHWQFKYNFRERARYLNQFDQFKTNIQGLDIHYLHVKPKVKDSKTKIIPLLLLHGWPSSVREFYEAIPLLTTETPGYDFVFEVIAPSLPGFVYSEAPKKSSLSPLYIAVIMRNLMNRLGFSNYVIQGGDYGHSIGTHMATLFPKEVIGFHTNFPINFSKDTIWTWVLGNCWPTLVEDKYTDRLYPLKEKVEYYIRESGYVHLQATKPDTVGIALHDSPLGLAAYIIEKFITFTDPHNTNFTENILAQYQVTDLLDNVVLYWISGSITTSLRLYKETVQNSAIEQDMARIPTQVPTWALRTKYEIAYNPDFMLRWKYNNLVGTTNLDHGGHFPAFEIPKIFADDLFKAVKKFLEFSKRK